MITIKLDEETVPAGGFLSASVDWYGDRAVRRIIVAAQWETKGEGNAVWGVGRSTILKPPGGKVRLMIPHEGPITFEGTLVKIVWKLRVQVDQPGFDEFGEVEFKVEPRRR
jgi:hypothetical protein